MIYHGQKTVLIDHHNIEEVHFKIASTKLYVKVATSSINDNIKFSENIKQEFKDNSWNKYRSEITTEPKKKNNNLDYLIDPTFRNIDRLFVLSFKNCDDDRTINYFNEYYMLLVQIKIFQALIDNKPFFDQPVKNKQEVYKKPVKRSINNDYTTGNLSDYLHHQKYYKHIGIYLS